MPLFMDSVKKAMPYLQKSWSQDVTPPPSPTEPPATHMPEKSTKKKDRGFTDLSLIVKAQELAVPAAQAAAASGDVAGASGALAAPTAWPAGR